MRRAIWKFDVLGPRSTTDRAVVFPARTRVPMPRGAHLLCAHEQDNRICVWAAVDQDADEVLRLIAIEATGNGSVEKEVERYVGSVFLSGGRFVFHLFDFGEEEMPEDPGKTFREIRDGP